ncbi:succinate dehydrogenase, hydrophobic membrane anchor protein [Thalassospiraceae bacterium LMO-SO8]|nr:succinate dehydrogenase, hydrophobic membrane anchor protein [Alphaproteobacteria bacterium LMO-S08]WND74372.1 succinate dehydrogenase, hydrophobic membrane anchor protein [Thalassospiraceae bacterium LMO-SO8]
MEMRSPLSRVRGLGAAHEGVAHWWAQRLTGVALVPLTLWFVWAVSGLLGADLAAVKAWMGTGQNAVLLILLIIAGMHHAQLGLQVVIEDYVHSESAKTVSLILIKLGAVLLGVLNIFAVLKLTFGS